MAEGGGGTPSLAGVESCPSPLPWPRFESPVDRFSRKWAGYFGGVAKTSLYWTNGHPVTVALSSKSHEEPDEHGVGEERCALRPTRTRRTRGLEQMDWSSVRGTRVPYFATQQFLEVGADSRQPIAARRLWGRQGR